MNRPAGRTEECNRAQAAVRLTHARAFLEVANLVGDIDDELANDNVSAHWPYSPGSPPQTRRAASPLDSDPAAKTTAKRTSW